MECKALYENALELARCMREGAKLHPQAIGAYVRKDNAKWTTCALGGAVAVKTDSRDSSAMRQLELRFDEVQGFLDEIAEMFPCIDMMLDMDGRNVHHAITYRNDDRRLSRERIADIIERWARIKLTELEGQHENE